MRTDKTAPWVVATAVAFGKKQGKTVIVVNDGTGFYTSRVLAPYARRGRYLLGEGVSVEAIDRGADRLGLARRARSAPQRGRHRRRRARRRHHARGLRRPHGPRPGLGQPRRRRSQGTQERTWLLPLRRRARKDGQAASVDPTLYGALGLRPARQAAAGGDPDALLPPARQRGAPLPRRGHPPRARATATWRRSSASVSLLSAAGPSAMSTSSARRRSSGASRATPTASARRWTPAPVLVEMAKRGTRFYGD